MSADNLQCGHPGEEIDTMALELVKQGVRVREMRNRKKLTLDEVAAKSGLSKGHLSRFERGEKTLSIAAMMRVASTLGTSMATMFGEGGDDEAIHVSLRKNRPFHKVNVKHGRYDYAVISKPHMEGGVNTLLINLAASALRTGDGYHAGDECLYVLEGTVEVGFADRLLVLNTGDYAQFPGHLKHSVKGVAPFSRLLVFVAPN